MGSGPAGGDWWTSPPLLAVVGFAGLLCALAVFVVLARARRQRRTDTRVGAPQPAVPRSRVGHPVVEPGEAAGWIPLEQTTTIVEELASVEEEAEVFLMLGRIDMAIGVLRHHIDTHSNAAPQVWLSLLDILHQQGQRAEFELLAQRMTERFNVARPTWEQALARSSETSALEHFPRLLDKIVQSWRRSNCLAYLRELVHDNRAGQRTGFQEEVFREILLLIRLQEHQAAARVR